MGEQNRPLCAIHHFEVIEHMPLAGRFTARTTYELVREAAMQHPEQTAITSPSAGERSDQSAGMSYGALLSGLHQTANLLADLGVGSQDVIALLLPDLLEIHLLFWGGQAIGIVCPISPWLPGEQIVAMLQAVKAKMLVAPGPQTSQDLWQKAETARREVKSITTMLQVRGPGEEQTAVYAFDALLEITRLTASKRGAKLVPTTSQSTFIPEIRLAHPA